MFSKSMWDGFLLILGQSPTYTGREPTYMGLFPTYAGQFPTYVRKCRYLLGTDSYLFVDGWLLSMSMSAKCDKFPTTYMNLCTIIPENSYNNTHIHMSVHILNSNLSTKLGICHISLFCDTRTIPSVCMFARTNKYKLLYLC